MLGRLLDIRRYAAAMLTLVAALLTGAMSDVIWWRPACDLTAEGGAYYGRGFPFPSATATGMSLEFAYMPHVQALNLIMLAAVLWPVVAGLVGAVERWTPALRWPLAWIALALALMVGGVGAMATAELGRPVWSITDGDGDHYWQFRPAAWVERTCIA